MAYFKPDVYASIDLSRLNGKLPFKMTNDYFFRAVMQENNHVLKALICSLLHLNEKKVRKVKILNPIILGREFKDKDIILDIFILLDNRMIINLEMQVINEGNWVERSQSYLCRAFDSLNKGDNYANVIPAFQIGILNYTLFKDAPEFFATYSLMNVGSRAHLLARLSPCKKHRAFARCEKLSENRFTSKLDICFLPVFHAL